jgi:hypothetical protein
MAKSRKVISGLLMLAALIILLSSGGCSKTSDSLVPTPARRANYNLMVKDVLGVTGKATFVETSSTETTVTIVLTGAPSGIHPAELCMNSAVEGGTVVLQFNPVDTTGTSITTVTSMTYSQLIVYDGFIKVDSSSTNPGVILVQGDIGGNVITTTQKSYVLDTVGAFGVSGTALFQKRVNGNTLVTLTVTGTIPGDLYPATINLGSISSVGGGPVVKGLNDVDGTNGKSLTNIRKLDSDVTITYDNWLVYDGYINIYQTSVGLGNVICHGNIGSN